MVYGVCRPTRLHPAAPPVHVTPAGSSGIERRGQLAAGDGGAVGRVGQRLAAFGCCAGEGSGTEPHDDAALEHGLGWAGLGEVCIPSSAFVSAFVSSRS